MFAKVDIYLLETISRKENNGELIPDSRYSNAVLILDYINSKIKFQNKEDNSAIISRDDITLSTLISGKTLTFCLNLLERLGLIESSRVGNLNGVKSYKVNSKLLKEMIEEGKTTKTEEYKKFNEKQKQIREETVKKIISNNEKSNHWSKLQTDLINQMAYDDITMEDKYNVHLNIYERLMIQLISKSYYRYSGEKINWTYRIFNGVRKCIAGRSKTDFKDNPEEYEELLKIRCLPYKLIDVGILLASDNFKKITGCIYNLTGLKINEAIKWVTSSNVFNILHENMNCSADHYYYSNGYDQIEDIDDRNFYMNKIDFSNFIKKDNPIDLYYKKTA